MTSADVTIIGGGVAGLTSAVLLGRRGLNVILIEKKKYPFHRVCGEYISNEVVPFLRRNALYPEALGPITINKLRLTSVGGKGFQMSLLQGGFGVSRYLLDQWLCERATDAGVQIQQGTQALSVKFNGNTFEIETSNSRKLSSSVLIGAFGKRSKVDVHLGRKFIMKRSPFVGVKYHVKTNLVDPSVISLHNFEGGYAGVCRVGVDTSNLCYLTHRSNLERHGSITKMEQEVLARNPELDRLLRQSESLFERPEVINEISFEKKEPVLDHVLMTGDAAGMITPLCGNGMAMAFHSAHLLSGVVRRFFEEPTFDRKQMEEVYAALWNNQFARRHWWGRQIQSMLFGSSLASSLTVGLGSALPTLANTLVSRTHGKPF